MKKTLIILVASLISFNSVYAEASIETKLNNKKPEIKKEVEKEAKDDFFEEKEKKYTSEELNDMSFKELFNKIHEKIEWERFKLDSKKTAIQRELDILKIKKLKLKAQNELIKLKQEFKELQAQQKEKQAIKKEEVEINKKEAEVKKIEVDNKRNEAEIKKLEEEMKMKEQEMKMKVSTLLNDKKRLAMELKERQNKLKQESEEKDLEIKDNKLKVEMKSKIITEAQQKLKTLKTKAYSFKMNESMFDGYYLSGNKKIYAIELTLLEQTVSDKEDTYQKQLKKEEEKLTSLTGLGENTSSKMTDGFSKLEEQISPPKKEEEKKETKDIKEKIIYVTDGFEYKGYVFSVRNDKNYVCVSRILENDNISCFKN